MDVAGGNGVADAEQLKLFVTAALIHADIIDKLATSKIAKKAVQEAFNAWAAESSEDLTTVSRVLALSMDG